MRDVVQTVRCHRRKWLENPLATSVWLQRTYPEPQHRAPSETTLCGNHQQNSRLPKPQLPSPLITQGSEGATDPTDLQQKTTRTSRTFKVRGPAPFSFAQSLKRGMAHATRGEPKVSGRACGVPVVGDSCWHEFEQLGVSDMSGLCKSEHG